MSETAHNESLQVDLEQAHRNDARRILQRVALALETKRSSGVRWPFELVQNAHDFGGREEDSLVDVVFVQQDDSLVVSHNGRIFSVPELKALLSGGSSKEFDSEETTGRFGTGFLVTHALSPRVDVVGILHTEEGQAESFSIKLHRPPDEPDILKNIEETGEAFHAAKPVTELEAADKSTATFTYHNPDREVVDLGLNSLERTIPYLYATCDKLGKFHIRRPHQNLTFHREIPSKQQEVGSFLMEQTVVSVSQDDATRKFTVLRISTQVRLEDGNDVPSSLLVVLTHNDSQRDSIHLPEPGFPKVFVQFPISETGFLPFNVVLNSRFNPKQERDGITMNPDDKALVKGALSAFPTLIGYAVESGWQNAHKLASLAVPERAVAGENVAEEERQWWREVISKVAESTASKPIIATDSGFLPALSEYGEIASFPVHAVDNSGQTQIDDYDSFDEFYELAARVTNLHLPIKEIAPDWGRIALEWGELDLPVERLGLPELAGRVKEGYKSIKELPVSGDPFQWLADLFLLAAKLPGSVRLLDWLVPDQNTQLRRVSELRIDGGIPEAVKDISKAVGIDLRGSLVHNKLMEALDASGYEAAKSLIQDPLQRPTEKQAVDEVLAVLEEKLPDGKAFSEVPDLSFLQASASMATYLTEADENTQRLRKCPLLTADDKVVRLPNNLQILAPVSHWPESSKPYAGLYKGEEEHILSDCYVGDSGLNSALQSLIDKSLVFPAPLYKATRPELDGDLLKAMLPPGTETEGVTVRNQTFSQIAFLDIVVSHCGRDSGLAPLLLGFVLNVAAKEDVGWSETNLVNAYRERAPLPLHIPGALWPAQLKVRSWIPATNEEGEITGQSQANEANLWPLLDSAWLRDASARDLLHHVFGFRRITLMLENLEPDVESDLEILLEDLDLMKSAVANLDAVRVAVENPAAAQLLQELGGEGVQEIWAELDVKKRQAEVRTRNNNFGHAVQAAVKEAVESLGLNLKLVDSGFDYEVFPDNSSFSFEVGSYFLEVKSTVSRDVRLTPKQAGTACKHSDRFVLCVVDLEDFPDAHAKENWQAVDVVPHAKIVTDIGGDFKKIYEGVTEFAADAGNRVRLRNEEQLRYGVSPDIWEKGVSIAEWVGSLKGSNQPSV